MQQLSPQDAVFLSMETPELPTHIGGLVFLGPAEGRPLDFERFVAFVRERLGPIERFSWRLQQVPFALDRPYWVETPDFDPANHLHCLRLPAPYSPEALSRLVGRIFERPMDRSRPLWDMVLIEGLPGDRHAVVWRLHHCLMDGASGANLAEHLFDLTPDATRAPGDAIVEQAHAGRPVSEATLLTRAARHAAELPLKQGRLLTKALAGLRSNAAASEDEDASTEAATAPPAPWNGVVGPHRGLAWSSVSLADVKRLKQTLGVTVNDVVLGITGGAVRDYLEARGELPEASLRASVPCSVRAEGDRSIGNQVRDMPVHWGTDVADPIARIRAIHASTTRAKQAAKRGDALDMIGVMSEAVLPGALNLFMRAAARAGDRMPLPANAVVSNVAMPPVPLYLAGAKIEQMVPISLLGPTQGLNITLVSYAGEIHFGLVHDPALLPDAWDLAGRIPKTLQALQQAVDAELEADPGDAPQLD